MLVSFVQLESAGWGWGWDAEQLSCLLGCCCMLGRGCVPMYVGVVLAVKMES